VIRRIPRAADPNILDEFRLPLKGLESAIGILMRWRYTEAILPQLEFLANSHIEDPLTLKGLRELARSLCLIDLPQVLKVPDPKPPFQSRGVPPARLIRQGLSLFPKDQEQLHPSELDFGSGGCKWGTQRTCFLP
jgi:hypothetical protein